MNLIKPNSDEDRTVILSSLATNIFRRLGLKIKPYDANAVKDESGEIHWMYVFDEQESRIYRTQNGTQRMADLDIERGEAIDLDDVERQVKTAIEKLRREVY